MFFMIWNSPRSFSWPYLAPKERHLLMFGTSAMYVMAVSIEISQRLFAALKFSGTEHRKCSANFSALYSSIRCNIPESLTALGRESQDSRKGETRRMIILELLLDIMNGFKHCHHSAVFHCDKVLRIKALRICCKLFGV